MSLPPFPAWQNAASEASFSDPAACAARASKFERTIRRRNLIEYAAGALVIVLFAASSAGATFRGEWLIALSMALTVVGAGFVMWGLHRRASNLDRRPEDPCVLHLRRQYERQFEALRDVPKWYLGPLVPGMALFYISVTLGTAEVTGWAAAMDGILWPVAATVGLFGAIALANWIAARSLKKKIDEIDALA